MFRGSPLAIFVSILVTLCHVNILQNHPNPSVLQMTVVYHCDLTVALIVTQTITRYQLLII